MLGVCYFYYKRIVSFIVKFILRITRISFSYPIEMMVCHLILGSINYVYLFNLAKTSELLTSASIYQSSSLVSTISYTSYDDISFPNLDNHYLNREESERLIIHSIQRISKQCDLIQKISSQCYDIQKHLELSHYISNPHISCRHYLLDRFCCTELNTIIQKDSRFPLNSSRSSHYSKYHVSPHWEKGVTASSLDKLAPSVSQLHYYDSTLLWLVRIAKNVFKDAVYRMNDASITHVMVVFIGYVLMSGTFVSLYIRMHRLGSKYTLATSVFMSGFFSFMLSLATIHKLGTPINPILLSEATPFLVYAIGFDRPCKLTKNVFERSRRLSHMDVSEILFYSIQATAPFLIHDGIIEIVIFTIGVKCNIPGLREFCLMSAFTITYDIIFMFTWYISVLSLKLKVASNMT